MRPLSSLESEDPRVVLVSMEKLMQIQKVLSKTHSQVYRGDIGVTLVYMKGNVQRVLSLSRIILRSILSQESRVNLKLLQVALYINPENISRGNPYKLIKIMLLSFISSNSLIFSFFLLCLSSNPN